MLFFIKEMSFWKAANNGFRSSVCFVFIRNVVLDLRGTEMMVGEVVMDKSVEPVGGLG